jgi:serine/threonine protein kinase
LRDLHSLGYVHNDLKLENILIGSKDPERLYLIDFGLTQRFTDPETGQHAEKMYIKKFSGNFLFASLNSCRGNNKSRRDDIESAIYILIYLLNNNYLPWCDIEDKFMREQMDFKDVLKERLQISYTKRLFKMIPCKFLYCDNSCRVIGVNAKDSINSQI